MSLGMDVLEHMIRDLLEPFPNFRVTNMHGRLWVRTLAGKHCLADFFCDHDGIWADCSTVPKVIGQFEDPDIHNIVLGHIKFRLAANGVPLV